MKIKSDKKDDKTCADALGIKKDERKSLEKKVKNILKKHKKVNEAILELTTDYTMMENEAFLYGWTVRREYERKRVKSALKRMNFGGLLGVANDIKDGEE